MGLGRGHEDWGRERRVGLGREHEDRGLGPGGARGAGHGARSEARDWRPAEQGRPRCVRAPCCRPRCATSTRSY